VSRIFGSGTWVAGGASPSVLARQAAALSLDPGWQHAIENLGPADLGWTGRITPRVARDAGAVVVLDGRVYNRSELGFARDDASGFLALYRQRGFSGALEAINGDLAVALFDRATDRLWLGRDRSGSKPMYWARTPGGVAFASQPRGLLARPDVARDVDRAFIGRVAGSHYRTFDNDRDRSPYSAIAQLPAGHLLEAGPADIRVRSYWDLSDQGDLELDEAVLAEQCRELLADSVRLRLEQAARPAFTLSGGMDSSSVLASAAQVSGAKQHALSTVYRDATYDETDEIKSMLDSTVSEWHPILVEDPDVIDVVSRLVAVHDEPVATATWLSHWVLTSAASADGFDTVFGGLGGDELNAGEYEYFVFHFADLRAQGREAELQHEVERWAAHHDHPIWRKDSATMEAMLSRRIDVGRTGGNLPDLHRVHQYAAAVRPGWWDVAAYAPVMDHPFDSHLKNRAYQDLFRETTPCCLRAEDRHSSAFGLEHADPFLDHRLVELMFRVSGDRKIRDGITKVLLRSAMRGVLPEETRTRIKKKGWNAPAHIWFSGASGDSVRDLIESKRFADRGIYDLAEVRRLFLEHQEIVSAGDARENHMMFLWQLVNLELWLRWVEDEAPR